MQMVLTTVHPRVCGERLLRHSHGGSSFGSSPRVRGTLKTIHDVLKHYRFIPACAGNAPNKAAIFLQLAVHPRVCGERDFRRFLYR